MKRSASITRTTKETEIELFLAIDGAGISSIKTSVGFLTHMLEIFSKQGLFDLKIKSKGDVSIIKDEHHMVEDLGIVMGKAFSKALGDKKGISRYGFFVLPMDEALGTVAVDFSGRSSFIFKCDFTREKVGDLSTELVFDFWNAFAQNAMINLYIKVEEGRNDHHKIEAIFKAAARAIRMACEIDLRMKLQIPSTKGVL